MAMTIVIKACQKKKKRGSNSERPFPSRQQTRIVFFTFERGQKRGLVFMPSKKIEAKEI